jgi:hypothetical protein
MRRLVTPLLCFVYVAATAQLKLVPKSVLDSIANPRTVQSEIVVEEHSVDFGRIAECDRVERRVAIRNIGSKSVAYRTTTSCRCLTASSGVVREDKGAEIVLNFSGKGFPGPFSHRVLVYAADQTTPTAVISVKGYVVASSDRSGDYPYTCGALLLRQPGVKICSNSTERIACLNSSNRAVRVAKDTLLSSEGLEIYTEPRVLQPAEQGDLVISLRAEKREDMKLYIQGPFAPSKREIKIE